ncbi:MAG: Crp/Fnr family transcriptional regulator [Gammaproteobacteria bacterium]|nr:cyclic nucleotide-binding domain-containing protein [Pseudomonadales bacterium]MCP5346850.1 cyclic nucleotide-binding domain-containing protein [Pseudomonadales bacterium]
MGIRLKLAETGKELDDVFWVRRQVYSVEEGKFGGERMADIPLVDKFDAHPCCANIIAYEGEEPIATTRVNLDTGCGLPPEKLYDFSAERKRVSRDWKIHSSNETLFVSAGMLAIRREWRGRRDVVRSLIKLATTIADSWEASHVMITANHENEIMFRRLGLTSVAGSFWVEEIGNKVVPMVAPIRDLLAHLVGPRLDNIPLLDCFPGQFQRLVYRAGEPVFRELDFADECYVVDVGRVKISTNAAENGSELVFADLGPGELFGEMALLDAKTRSANATTVCDTELIALRRDDFMEGLQKKPERLGIVLRFIFDRLRRTDEFAKLLAYGSATQRTEFALKGFIDSGRLKERSDGTSMLRVGPVELAAAAATDTPEVISFLDDLSQRGICKYNDTRIEFLRPYNHLNEKNTWKDEGTARVL